MFEISPGDTITDQFAVFEDDGITKHTGLVQADFDIVVWQDGVVTALAVTVTEIGTSGEYKLVYTPPTEGYWKVELFSDFSEEYYVSLAAVGVSADLTGVKGDLARILALLHHNAMVDQHSYTPQGDLLSARVRGFDNPGNVPPVPNGAETTGLKYQWAMTATYSSPGILESYTMKRVL
jgi:hypothetical protein